MDSSAPSVVCEVPASGDRTARYALPRAFVSLLDLCDGERSLDEVIAEYGLVSGGEPAPDRLRSLFHGFLVPKGFVAPDPDVEPAVPVKRRPTFLHVQVPLFSARQVDPVARRLRWAFQPAVMGVWGVAIALLHLVFYLEVLPQRSLDTDALRTSHFLLLMVLTTASTLLHELGHASAASRFGCRRFEIGWGLYLWFTVLYADVSDAWRLPRRQRMVVDLGGIYFQSAFLVAMYGLWWWTADPLYVFAFLITDFAIVASFNPFLRLDGYWLLSDMFGIANLRRRSLGLFRSALGRLAGRADAAAGGEAPLGRRAALVLGLYTFFGAFFFTWLAWVLIDVVVVQMIGGYPAFVTDVVAGWRRRPVEVGQAVASSFELLWRTVVLVGLATLAVRVLRGVARRLARGPVRRRADEALPAVRGEARR